MTNPFHQIKLSTLIYRMKTQIVRLSITLMTNILTARGYVRGGGRGKDVSDAQSSECKCTGVSLITGLDWTELPKRAKMESWVGLQNEAVGLVSCKQTSKISVGYM